MKKIFFDLILMITLLVSVLGVVSANTVASSTIVFEGELTYNAETGSYTGTLDATEGNYYIIDGEGEEISTDGGFDVYGEEDGCAYVEGYYGTGDWNCDGTDTYLIDSDNDAYPSEHDGGPWGEWYDPDIADWYEYSLELTEDHWYLRYTSTSESPMSGDMNWNTKYAKENDLGTQDGGHDGSEIHGGGTQAWDWDCGWGVEVIPLEFPGFDVSIENLGGDNYNVSLTPSEKAGIISPEEGDYVREDVSVSWNGNWDEGYLKYSAGACDGSTSGTRIVNDYIDSEGEATWDTEELDDGEYCLKITNMVVLSEINVIIDNSETDAVITSPVENEEFVVGEEIEFDGSDSVGNIVTYSWDFDNGDTREGSIVSYAYSEAGTYEVRLTVTDQTDNTDYEDVTIIVNEPTFTDEFEYEVLIKEDLSESFETGLTGVDCAFTNDFPDGLVIGSDGSSCTLTWDGVPYEDRGEYELSIKAEGDSEIKYYGVNLAVYTWMIDLEEGWNLVSIPMMPEDTSIESVLGGIKENIAYGSTSEYTIFQYDGVAEDWDKARPTGSWAGDLDNVIPGYGYWIKMAEADTLKGYGSITPDMDGAMLGVDVANGWNLIGHYGLENLIPGNALSSLATNLVTYWDSISTSGNMTTGEGYWMTVKFLPEETALYAPSQDALNSVF